MHRREMDPAPKELSAPVKLVATDLDGTLLRSDGTISERTRHCIERVRSAGVAVVLVTARPPRTLKALAGELGLPAGLALCCNGAMVYDLERDEIAEHSPLRSEVAADIIAALRRTEPGVRFALELGVRWGWEPGFAELNPAVRQPGGMEGEALQLCAVGPVTKLIVRHGEMPVDRLLQVVRGLVGDAAHATHSGAPFVEISAAGVHKARSLAGLCAGLGVAPSEVIAFGDMPNDLPMLEWAGRSVAVANSDPQVLAAADEVAPSNEEDGVALVLDRLLAPPSEEQSGCAAEDSSVRLVAFDLDGTLLRGDTVCQAIARRMGHLERMDELERLTDFAGIAAAREELAGYYAEASREELLSHLEGCTLARGTEEAFTLLRSHGVRTAVVSITWGFAAEWFARRLGADYWIGTGLSEDGRIEHFWPADKARWVRELMGRLGLQRDEVAAVGDSWGDVDMLSSVGHAFFVGRSLPPDLDATHLPDGDILEVTRQVLWPGTL